MLRLAGLGLLVGAVLQGELAAQRPTPRDTVPRRDTVVRRDSVIRARDSTLRIPVAPQIDSVLRDSLRKRDSLRAVRPAVPRRDSVQAPISRAESPRSPDSIGEYFWTRDAIFAAGTQTLVDLLDRVPGLTGIRGGYIAAPAVGAYLGDPARVRVFMDGIELPALDPRGGSVRDLSWIQLWPYEEVRIERGASEVRVHLRTWRVERLTPSSRVDVGTGDQQTNLFRGYFGRRYQHGEVLQVGGQQFSTTPPRLGASSDQLGLLARVGIARERWSVGGFVLRTTVHRGFLRRLTDTLELLHPAGDSIPEVDATRTDAYLRFAYGDPERNGPWLQAIAASLGHRFTGRKKPDTTFVRDPVTLRDSIVSIDTSTTLDSSRVHGQYVLTGGLTRGPIRLSATNRLTAYSGQTFNVPSVRANYESRLLGLTLFAEARGVDSTSRIEAAARFAPLSFLSFSGTAGQLRDERSAGTADGGGDSRQGTYMRAEGALLVGGLRLGGGLLRRGAALLAPPSIFSVDTVAGLGDSIARRTEPGATGAFVQVRGRLYRALGADVYAVRWDSEGLYRPKYQTRSELYLATTLPQRFPNGNFGLLVSLVHEYQSDLLFPSGATGLRRTDGFRTLAGVLEIRLLDAVLTYQYRNVLGEIYAQAPGYLMPRQTQYYGVRWSFWN
jgi:hypothetical protein